MAAPSFETPGEGGNLNSMYEGWGTKQPMNSDFGYAFGQFPVGKLPTGGQPQTFELSDSEAFSGLRGVAKMSHPFAPNPTQDHPLMAQAESKLTDNFQISDIAGVSSLAPGRFSYNRTRSELGSDILAEFDAGKSTMNTLRNAAGGPDDVNRRSAARPAAIDSFAVGPTTTHMDTLSVMDQHRLAAKSTQVDDVPITPFHRVYPNFGSGNVDYGFNEPGTESMSNDILKAYQAVLPEGTLAGTKKDLMPVFSGVNQLAIEQRPMLQSRAAQYKTVYAGGQLELPDEIRIDPRIALMAGSNMPAKLIQTPAELASAFEYMQYQQADKLSSTSPYGDHLPPSRTLTGGHPGQRSDWYQPYTASDPEPAVFSGDGEDTYAYSYKPHTTR